MGKRRGPLPGGASGIEFGELALSFQEDKVIMISKSSNEHLTLHIGRESKVLDIHRTSPGPDGLPVHYTIFAITYDNLHLMLEEFGSKLKGGIKLGRRLRIGWLARKNITVLKGLESWTDDEIRAVTDKSKRNRLMVNPEKLMANVVVPEYLEDLWSWQDGWFSLFFRTRRIGLGVKMTDHRGRRRLLWVRLRDLTRLSSNARQLLIETAKRHGIPEAEYERYNIARRS